MATGPPVMAVQIAIIPGIVAVTPVITGIVTISIRTVPVPAPAVTVRRIVVWGGVIPRAAPAYAQMQTRPTVAPSVVKRVVPERIVKGVIGQIRCPVEAREISAIPRAAESGISEVAVHDYAVPFLGLIHGDLFILRLALAVEVLLVVPGAHLRVAPGSDQR